jgi:hypothetical protein
MNDHDLLIRIDERVENIEVELSNHLTSHSKANIVAWSTAAGAILALIILLLKLT